MNCPRRDDEQVELWNVRQRIDFVALANAERAATFQEKGDIGAEAGGQFEQPLAGQLVFGKAEIPNERGCRVARAAAQPSASRNGFAQFDGDAVAFVKFLAQCIHCAIGEIFLDRLT